MTIEAEAISNLIINISSNEIFDISELKEFKILLINDKEQAEVVNFDKWKNKNNNR